MKEITKTFCRYVSMNIVGMLGISFYILADTFFIAQGIGADGLTALNLVIPVYNLFHGIGLMIGMGGATRYSLALGTGNETLRRNIFSQSVYYMLLCAAVFVSLGITAVKPLSLLLGANADTLQLTVGYLRILLIFTPFFMCNNLLICFVRNDSAPQRSMAGMLAGSLFNVIMDYVLIFVFDMGMQGAALATAASPLVSMVVLSGHFIHKKNKFRFHLVRPSVKCLADISALGSSSLIVEVSSGIVMLVFNLLILRISGNIGVAAYGVVANIALVLTAIFNGISQGIQPLISQNFGRRNYPAVKQVLCYALVLTLVLALLSYGLMYFANEPIVALFNKEKNPTLQIIAENGMRLYFTALPFIGINIITATFLSSVASPKQAFVLSVARGIVVVIPTAFLLAAWFDLNGIWMTIPVTELFVSLLSARFLKKRIKYFSV